MGAARVPKHSTAHERQGWRPTPRVWHSQALQVAVVWGAFVRGAWGGFHHRVAMHAGSTAACMQDMASGFSRGHNTAPPLSEHRTTVTNGTPSTPSHAHQRIHKA